jgi:GTP cyclohydrolase I
MRAKPDAAANTLVQMAQIDPTPPQPQQNDASRAESHDDPSDPAPLPPAEVDQPRIERAVREILIAIGEDPDREGLLRTPHRVAKAYAELFAGLREEPKVHLRTVFDENYDEVVLLRDIPFHSMCEHHLLPFTGRAHVAYLPKGKVVGLSKLARLVEGYARRPQVQERLTMQIADALVEELDPKGAAVIVEATHTCMTMRGVKKTGSIMATSAVRGLFKSDARTRGEVMSLMRGGDRML